MNTSPEAPNYALLEGWLVKPDAALAPVDVFFVYPTSLFDDTDWSMDTARPDMRDAAMVTVTTQASVFEGQANIYAGLGLSDADAAPLQKIAHDDVWRALTHYLQHENNGRPFFLAVAPGDLFRVSAQ